MIDAIVDLSHHNSEPDFAAAKAAGLLGVIFKATQGTGYVDPTLAPRRAAARAVGLMTGVYHFGVGGDGAAQAGAILAQALPGDLIALDLEPNPDGPNMTADDAAECIEQIQLNGLVVPVLYGGGYLKDMGAAALAPLTVCPLWLAQYGPQAVVPPGWTTWALWQYSDGTINPPASTWPGIDRSDRNCFNGDAVALTAFWKEHSLLNSPANSGQILKETFDQ